MAFFPRAQSVNNADPDVLSLHSEVDGVPEDVPAVHVRNLCKAYGDNIILSGMNMMVPQGCIYGLLGPSGCGKTTFLKMITGRLSFATGVVQVYGSAPGTPHHPVPGHLVGYMPQEIALFGDFTISETLEFYSRLYNIPHADFLTRREFLVKFLNLPDPERQCKNLSGGQQRRVSLAVALIHEPRLLILDEPTVGVDPLLRIRIWNHLVELARMGVSVIITTHYIEEARQADRVGMMRNGKLLAEGKPTDLMRKFRQNSLEDVFLRLCETRADPESGFDSANPAAAPRDTVLVSNLSTLNAFGGGQTQQMHPTRPTTTKSVYSDDGQSSSVSRSPSSQRSVSLRSQGPPSIVSGSNGSGSLAGVAEPISDESDGSPPQPFCGGCPIWRIAKTLVWKNWVICRRNIGFLIFQFLLPALQVMLFCLAIGDQPSGLKVGIVQLDQGVTINTAQLAALAAHSVPSSDFKFDHISRAVNPFGSFARVPSLAAPTTLTLSFGDAIVRAMDATEITQVQYSSYEAAVADAKKGVVWGVVHMLPSFSRDMLYRLVNVSSVRADIIANATVEVHLDNTDQQIALSISTGILNGFLLGMQGELVQLQAFGIHASTAALRPAVQLVSPPIYGGTTNPKFTDFIAPGMIIAIAFAQSIGLTAMSLVMARLEGTLDRQWAAGVKPSELMISHVLTQLAMLVIQILVLLGVAVLVFQIPCHGSVLTILALTVLLGLAGSMYGLFLSSICSDEQECVQYSTGSFFPVMLLSGILWPVEGIPGVLRYVAMAMPTTWAATALRDLMARGWGLTDASVWQGFLVVLGWCIFFLFISSRGVRNRD